MRPKTHGLVLLIAALVAAGCQALSSGTGGIAPAPEAPLDVRASGPPAGRYVSDNGQLRFVAEPGQNQPRFTVQPTARATAAGAAISFAVSAPTDAEVSVLDAQGKVVRHLAAGLLGKNAPEPFRKDSLAQTISWDGKDDNGNQVLGRSSGVASGGGGFKVRVRLGVAPRFERIVGWDETPLGVIRGLGVGPGGELFVLHGGSELRVLDRDGRYLRTIMPYPAGTPKERTASVGHIELGGDRLPIVFNGMGHTLSPMTMSIKKQTMAWNPKGFLVAVSSPGTATEHGPPQHLLAFHPQGGAPDGVSFVGPRLRWPTGLSYGQGDWGDPRFEHLAASTDGNWIYYVPATYNNPHGVFRLKWGEDVDSGMEAAFIGEQYRPGSDDRHLNDPQGLAVDAQGRIYVCDRGNSRVIIFSPQGTFVGNFAVSAPKLVAVHPETGEIYVLSRPQPPGGRAVDIAPMSSKEYRDWRAREARRAEARPKPEPFRLLKFSAWGAELPRELARLDLDADVMVLDSGAKPAKLWLCVRDRLTPVIDRGTALEPGQPINPAGGLPAFGFVIGDPDRDRVILQTGPKYVAVDLATGKRQDFVSGVGYLAMAPDGTFVGVSRAALTRFDASGKPLPFQGTASAQVKIAPCDRFRGLCVSPAGDIYLLRVSEEKAIQARLDVFGTDGKLKTAALVDGLGIGDCGLAVDGAGAVYIGVNVKPRDRLLPPEFADKLPVGNWVGWGNSAATWNNPAVVSRQGPWWYPMKNEYLYHWGAIFKFGPGGGAFYGRSGYSDMLPGQAGANISPLAYCDGAPAGAAEYRSGYLTQRVRAAGVLWRFAGIGIIPSSERILGDPGCVCNMSQLALDEYGRVFGPDCFSFCVHMLDANGNEIARIGRYGNIDNAGPGSGAPDPDIPFAWPAYVSAAGERVFVSDPVNRRITVVRLDAAAEGVTDLRK